MCPALGVLKHRCTI